MIEHITQEFLDMIKLPDSSGRHLNYLLVMPRMMVRKDKAYLFPYGFCMVSAALKASGRSVFTLNLNYKKDIYSLLKQTIEENSIDVVATGGLSGQYALLKEITDAAKQIKPDIITMVGGGIITAEPITALEALETADYGMIGEGEITINELAYALEHGQDPSKVEGVVVKNYDYSQSQYLLRPEIMHLDTLPFPDYDGFEYYMLMRDGLYSSIGVETKTAVIATGRSCPFNCTFCFHSSGKKYRKRSIENVLEEIDWIRKCYDIQYLVFVDELFASDMQYLKELVSQIKTRNIKYWVQTRVDMVSKETLELLKDSGCFSVAFGVESADNRILKSMQKKITVEQIECAFDWAHEVGLTATGNIILGDPEETEETIKTSLKWWKDHLDYNINLWWILTFPGSHLYHVACERGLIPDHAKYLRENNMQLNVSKLSDKEYWEMVDKVELYQVLVSDGYPLDFDNVQSAIQMISIRLNDLLECHKIAVWPATVSNISMLRHISPEFVAHENVVFVNADPQGTFVHGVEQCGKKVYTPEEAFEQYDLDIVIYAFIYREANRVYKQICEMTQKSYPGVKRVVKLSELLS